MGNSWSESENTRLKDRAGDRFKSYGREVTVEAIGLFKRKERKGLNLLEGPQYPCITWHQSI